MWICMNDAYLSIVADKDDPGKLMVRARAKGDIERVFPGAKVRESDRADYMYRAFIDRSEVSKAIAKRLLDIRYESFKDTVEEEDRHLAYLDIWSRMRRFQEKRLGRRKT